MTRGSILRYGKEKPVPYPSITATTKQKLHALDSGRCLITFEKTPTASQQIVHILSCKTTQTMLSVLGTMWQASPSSLKLDSVENLVTLRADWRLSYDNGDWALVPAEHVLQKILECGTTSTFDKPYPEFDADKLHDYMFVPLPTFRPHYILRQMVKFDEDEGHSAGEGNDEDKDDREDGEVDSGDKRQDEHDMVDVENGNAIVHIKPFSGFPLLKHHAHPFFVIRNALPKLRQHMLLLCLEHDNLLTLLTKIETIWRSRLPKGSTSSKLKRRRREASDDADNDRLKLKARGTASADSKHGNSSCADRTKTRHCRAAQSLASQSSTMPIKDFLFDDISEITAWSAAVAAAGAPEKMDETVVWSDEEPVRTPIKNWDRWRIPYKRPKQRARFCSSDWPMYFYSQALWVSEPD